VRTRHSVVLVGLAAAAVWFVATTVLIPVRVTFGGGSLRCGTVLHPDTDSEVARVCPAVTGERLDLVWLTAAIFAAATSLSSAGGRIASRKRGVVATALAGVVVLVWLMIAGSLLLWVTGSHSAPGL
jgi:hypothetical protein